MSLKDDLQKIKFARMSEENKVLGNLINNSNIIKYDKNIEIYYNEKFDSIYSEVIRIEHRKKRIYFNVALNYIIKKFRKDDDWTTFTSKPIIDYLHFYFAKYKDYDIYGKILN